MSFLTAEWRKLAMFNYLVEPDLLLTYVPKGTSLDLFQGKCLISVVGFRFLDTRLMGIPVPFHRHFEEVNLRFYVVRKTGDIVKRGVVFIKEIVPKAAITFVANTIFKEHYQTMPMNHLWEENGEIRVEYSWGKTMQHTLKVTAGTEMMEIKPGSEEAFIAEHYWGYSGFGAKTFEYEVKHPSWQIYPIHTAAISIDFEALYGSQFAFLSHHSPASVFLAEGSAIAVENKVRIV